jgi:Flp pilus assembly CpaF family ATPase
MSSDEKGVLHESNSIIHKEVLHFLRYELRLLKPGRGNAHLLIAHLVDSAYQHFNLSVSPEEKSQLVKQLLPEYQQGLSSIRPPSKRYHPPFIIKANPELHVSAQNVAKAAKAFSIIHHQLMDLLDVNRTVKMNRQQFSTYLSPLIGQCLRHGNVSLNAVEQLVLEVMLLDEMLGFGPLEPLLTDPTVNDILVNAPDKIYVERNGYLERSAIAFRDIDHLLHTIHLIVARAGRRIDGSHPYVNVKLEDGTRINAIIPPIVLGSPTLSIRKFSKQPIYLETMVMHQNLSAEMAMFLNIAVKCRLNILISGGTGSGKTTLLNAMSDAIAETERIITIEDIAELRLNKEHVVRLETRNANIEGGGSVSERELLINALRMRPDRLIIGEVRGSEAFDMFRRIIKISELAAVKKGEVQFQNLFEFQYQINEQTNIVEGTYVQNKVTPLFMSKAANFGLDQHLKALFRL